MNNGDEAAWPGSNMINPGLSKLEYFSAMAMQGILADYVSHEGVIEGARARLPNKSTEDLIGTLAINHAKGLLKILGEPEPQEKPE